MKLKSILFALLIASQVFAQSRLQNVKSQIDSVLSNKYFESTAMGIDVYDLTARQTIYLRNEKLLLKPASNLKILTTSTALVFLGPDYKFKTSLYYTGEILNGILYGDLFVAGGCDPDFTTADIDSLASAVKEKGIKEITGNIFGDVSMMDSLFWGKGWMWDDDPSTDAPYLTPLDINTNSIGIIVKPGKLGGKGQVTLVPESCFFNVENYSVTVPSDSQNTVTLDRDWINRKNTLLIKGNIPDAAVPDSLQDTLRVNVYDPQSYFLTLFRNALNSAKISVGGRNFFSQTPDYAKELFDFERPYKNIIDNLNKSSYNLGAEMSLYAVAAQFFGKPATAKNGIKMVDSLITLSGMNPADYRIVDGSGVSHYNLISAQLLLSVLKYIYNEKPTLYKILYNSFPIAGVDGTLNNRMINTPAQGNVHAKTGTLSGVCSISGYLTADNGHLIAFSMLVQNYTGSASEGRAFQDQICNILVGY